MRVLVAGASRGIGLGICKAFAERGDEVIATCRAPAPELEAVGVEVVEGIDFTSDEAVQKLRLAVGSDRLDALIYNAAINLHPAVPREIEGIEIDGAARMFDVNVLGAIRVVQAFLPALGHGSRIMLVGSDGAFNPGASRGSYGYRLTKAALASLGIILGRELRERGIAVVVSAPGATNTDMLRETARAGLSPIDPAALPTPLEIGRLFRDRIDELTVANSPAWQSRPTGEPIHIDIDRHALSVRP